jgi:hypothetical protein
VNVNRGTTRRPGSSPFFESLALKGSIVLAAGILALGAFIAHVRCDPHWMNRAGAAVVALQALVAGVEFTRRQRLQSLEADGATPSKNSAFLRDEIERAEAQALTLVLVLAFVGELIHGFGDILFEIIVRHVW